MTEVIDGGSNHPVNIYDPSIQITSDDHIFIAYDSRPEGQVVLWNKHEVSTPWIRSQTHEMNFMFHIDLETNNSSNGFGCIVTKSTISYFSDISQELSTETIDLHVSSSCSTTLSSDGTIHVFFGKRGQVWHAMRHPDDPTWSKEPIADGDVEAIDSAQGPDGLHVVFETYERIFHIYNVENEWRMEHLGKGTGPSLGIDKEGNIDIITHFRENVFWIHKTPQGEWLEERPFEGGWMKSVRHVGMALDPAGYPTMLVTELSTPWSIRSVLVRRKNDEWKVSEVPWTGRTAIAFDTEGKIHAVFADAEGVKHAVR